MPNRIRLSLVALGLAAAVYGTASLTGGWLGTPPWYQPPVGYGYRGANDPYLDRYGNPVPDLRSTAERALANIGSRSYDGGPIMDAIVVAAGLALAVFGVWPRRRRAEGSR